jgi:hypothetical protein
MILDSDAAALLSKCDDGGPGEAMPLHGSSTAWAHNRCPELSPRLSSCRILRDLTSSVLATGHRLPARIDGRTYSWLDAAVESSQTCRCRSAAQL